MGKVTLNWNDVWYRRSVIAYLLWPLSCIYGVIVLIRRWLYRIGLLSTSCFSPVVVVVGNITVGGTGKSPMVAYLARWLSAQGWRIGLVSRGYGGKASSWPQAVTVDSHPSQVGDEALMLVQQTGCPMVVGPDRVAAVNMLLDQQPLDCVISDDGLQHYALHRDIEIVLVDAIRKMGNGLLLPAGPLRESAASLHQYQFVVSNGSMAGCSYQMNVLAGLVVNLVTGERRTIESFAHSAICAVAGIGHPQRYFSMLEQAGLRFVTRTFVDHHHYVAADFDNIEQAAILLTEKDAVKCRDFADQRLWAVAVHVDLDVSFQREFQLAFERALATGAI